MSHPEIDQTMTTAADAQPSAAMMQVLIDAHGKPGDQPKTETLAQAGIEHRGGSDDQGINQFPNGVKFGVGPGIVSIEAPKGGKVLDKNGDAYGYGVGIVNGGSGGGAVVYDAHNHVVAEYDKNKVLHVHAKNGEYTETADGQVTFKPASAADLTSLHKTGAVSQSKYENYGVSTNGHTTRFGNGVEYDSTTGGITIPSEYPNFHEDKKYDLDDHLVARVGTDGEGKVLYTIDRTGMHVPTADGTLTQANSGALRFDAKPAADTLPNVTITDNQKGS